MSTEEEDCICTPCTEDEALAAACQKAGIIKVGKYAAVADKNYCMRYIPNKKNSLFYNNGNNPDWRTGSSDEKLLLDQLMSSNAGESAVIMTNKALSQIFPDPGISGPQILAKYDGVLKFHPDQFREACFNPGQILDKNCGRIALLSPGPSGGLCLYRFSGCTPGSTTLRALLVDGDGEVSCGTITASDVLPDGEPCQVLVLDAEGEQTYKDIGKTIYPIALNPQVSSGSGNIDSEKTVNVSVSVPAPPALATHIFLRAHVHITSADGTLIHTYAEMTIKGVKLCKVWTYEHASGYNSTGQSESSGSALIPLETPNTTALAGTLAVGRIAGLGGPGTAHQFDYTIHADFYAVSVCEP